jgi:LemA protein
MDATSVVFVVIAFIVIFAIASYNYLVRLRNHIDDAWSNIDTELKRRYELIPNLVEAVKAYAAHERDTLEQVIRLRNECATDHGSVQHQEGTEKQFVGAVKKLLVLAEAYPDLKADKNFLALQKELSNTEDRIQAARRFYNGNVRDYRNRSESFPGNLVANLFKFPPREFFNVDPAVRTAPSIEGAFDQ